MKRRPSFAAIVALLALFVALGGPAEAQRLLGKGDVRSREVKDRSLKLRDLERRTVRALRGTVNNSITEAKLANGSVTPGKLAPGAVGSAAIGDRSIGTADLMTGAVTGTQIADGSLSAADLGRFYGRFQLSQPIPALPGGSCWAREPAGLAPELARADISQDLVIVTPDAGWPEERLTFTVSNSADTSRFVLTACNPTGHPSTPVDVGFRYLVVDLP